MGLLDTVKGVFTGGQKSVIGIDIGSSAIKVVQARQERGVAVLETYGSLALGPYKDGQVGQYVKTEPEVLHTVLSVLLKEAKVTSRNAGISIPFHSSLISIIDVPPLSDEKIAQAIPFEARRHIPIPLEEVSIDWFIIPQALLEGENTPIFENEQQPIMPKEEKRKVLLIAIHNHELMRYKKIAEYAKLQVNFFEIEIFSALRGVVHENRYPIMIIDIGAQTTKFYILEHGIVLRSYFIKQGGQTITNAIMFNNQSTFQEAESQKRQHGLETKSDGMLQAIRLVLNEVFTEANTAISDFENRYRQSVGSVILTGGGATLRGLLPEAQKNFTVSVELADPFSRLKHPLFLSETLKNTGPEFSVALGAALRMLGS